MRYYDLIISNPTTNAIVRRWTSHPNGVNQPPDPGALNIEFDVMVSNYGSPANPGGSVITIEGVPIADLFQAQQFAGMTFTLKAGMGKGLPLSNPAQSGLIMSGFIFQSFGNWVGTEMTLDLVVFPDAYNLDAPGNFSVNWPAGLPLNTGIAQVLNTAYPGIKQYVQIQSGIVFPNAEFGIFSTLRQFAAFVLGLTAGYFGPDYNGVNIAIQGGQFFVYDGSETSVTVPIAFNDLIGQPTWIDVNLIQIKTVLRADVQMSNKVKMPQGLQGLPGMAAVTAQSLPSSSKYQSAFQGAFSVYAIRHIGNFRAPDGNQWATILNCSAPVSSNG